MTPEPQAKPLRSTLRQTLLNQSEAMVLFAAGSGKEIPPQLVQTLERFAGGKQPAPESPEETGEPAAAPADLGELVEVHSRLARIIAPARPDSVYVLQREARGASSFLGSVALVRRMVLIAALFLFGFIALTLSPDINDAAGGNIYKLSGWPLLINQMFFFCAAGIGAAFSALFQANQYIIDGTYQPKYESSYWVRFALGLMAGIILADLVEVSASAEHPSGFDIMAKPTLALLGGFSAQVVYRILNRMIETVESLVRGSAREATAMARREAEAQTEETLSRERARTASRLIGLKQALASGRPPEDLHTQLDRVMAELVPEAMPGDKTREVEPRKPQEAPDDKSVIV